MTSWSFAKCYSHEVMNIESIDWYDGYLAFSLLTQILIGLA